MRKLATIRKIAELRPIEGADAIEAAVVDGWTVVVKKGEFQAGQFAVFCEIDSWIPTDLAPFLSKGKEPREFNGVKGERLRTVKLRGQLSQGLLLPINVLPHSLGFEYATDRTIGEDVSYWLGVQKWEAPIPAQLAGEVRSTFPGFIPKTDQERVQNLVREVEDYTQRRLTFEVTEKLDGSSMTVYSVEGDEGVCSRNLDLKETETNTFWSVARREGLLDKIAGMNIALQGELIGEGIQKNPYGIKGQDFYVFDIYDINKGEYFTPARRRRFCEDKQIKHVPVIAHAAELHDTLGLMSVEDILKFAEAKSVQGSAKPEREGVVFKCCEDPATSFKAISNKFLLKGGD